MRPSPASEHADPAPAPRSWAGRTAARVHSALVRLWLAPVRLYRKFLSPLKGPGSCRFTPTCSRYAMEAVAEWGILCGTVLAVIRVIRCNPFSRGGYDPVPSRKAFFAKLGAKCGVRTRRDSPEPEDPRAHQSPMEH